MGASDEVLIICRTIHGLFVHIFRTKLHSHQRTMMNLQSMFLWISFMLIVNRQFYCNESSSTFSISYQYVYCRASTLSNPFKTILNINVNGTSEIYNWTQEDDGYVPSNASTYTDGYSFSAKNDSNIFECLDTSGGNTYTDNITNTEYNVNAITVSYEYTLKVDSTDSILVQISNYLDNHNYWFMISDVEIRCLSMFLTFSLLR